jgi:uncharacterized protein
MPRSSWSRACIRAIERYRRLGAGRYAGRCRFDPSCSTFALEAFRTRAFLVALWMAFWRVLRCNPLVPQRSRDPVREHRRLRLRPGAVPTFFSFAALAGFFVMGVTVFASAQSITGGCSASVNGRDPASMTSSDPLVVSEGETVSVEGSAPSGSGGESVTTVTVSGIEGVVGFSGESHAASGEAWGGQVNVDDYLKWGTGLYLVEADATGSGWSCSASGYVKLDGNPLTKPIGLVAAGFTLVGGVGAALSARPKRAPSAEQIKQEFGQDVDRLVAAPGASPPEFEAKPDTAREAWFTLGCLLLAILPLFLVRPIAAVVALPMPSRRIMVHGHAILGAMAGFLAGIGVAVLGQQYAFWPLTPVTAFGIPAWFALLGGVRGYLGRPWKVEFRVRHDSTFSATEPPPPPPMPGS